MIRNDEELVRANQRLELLKDELAILRYDVLPGNRRAHDLMCEYFVKRIDTVHTEIDTYLAGSTRLSAEDEAPYNERLETAYGDRGQP